MSGKVVPKEIAAFVARGADVQALVQRVGKNTFDLVFVDAEGNWTRYVYESEERAKAAGAALGVPVHDGWTDELTKRVGARNDWDRPGGTRRAL